MDAEAGSITDDAHLHFVVSAFGSTINIQNVIEPTNLPAYFRQKKRKSYSRDKRHTPPLSQPSLVVEDALTKCAPGLVYSKVRYTCFRIYPSSAIFRLVEPRELVLKAALLRTHRIMHSDSLFYILISHPYDSSILTNANNQLPSLIYEGDYYSDPQEICSLIQEAIGCSFRLDFLHPEAEERCHFYYRAALLVFNLPYGDKPDAPQPFKWVPMKEADIVDVHPRKESVLKYLQKYKVCGLNANGERLRPYSRAGWLAEAFQWLKLNVEEFSKAQVQEITKLRTGSSACVLRAKTSEGKQFYMKSVFPSRPYDEISAALAVSTVMPRHFRKPVVVDRERLWMCMEDYGRLLADEGCTIMETPELVEEILDEWGYIQEESVGVINELKLRGVPVLGANEIMSKLEEVVSDPQWYDSQLAQLNRHGMKEYGQEDYIVRFLRYAKEVLDKVSDFNLPLTLVHGDLNPVNVARDLNGHFTFFDFDATCISYPLLDAMNFLFVCNECNTATFDDLWFYTQRWSKYESEERLKDMFDMVTEVENLVSVCNAYESWLKAEESERLLMFTEMGSPAARHFEAWEESKMEVNMNMDVDG
ncbi:unnamed protein product [Agarophyton chilense]